MMTMLMVFDAFVARLGVAQLTTKVIFKRCPHCPFCSCGYSDSVLVKEADSPPTHTAAEHHINSMIVDELRNHTRLVLLSERVVYTLYGLYILVIHIHKHAAWAAPKVVADQTV
jgi:hypothetical protein